jgi:hypothetical protein
LRYSLRSLEAHAPWIRNVYLVTNGHLPGWLDTAHPRLRLERHDQLFERPDQLPTFNSMAIESTLHRLPDVSRRFLFFNDDIFLGRPLNLAGLVASDGLPCSLVVRHRSIAGNSTTHSGRPDRLALSAEILTRRFGSRRWRDTPHTPTLFDVELMREIAVTTPEIAETANHPIRHVRDVSMRFLHVHTLAQRRPRGLVFPAFLDRRYTTVWPRRTRLVMVGSERNVAGRIRAIERSRPAFFCINDDMDEDASAFDDVRSMLERMFPAPSSFECGER